VLGSLYVYFERFGGLRDNTLRSCIALVYAVYFLQLASDATS